MRAERITLAVLGISLSLGLAGAAGRLVADARPIVVSQHSDNLIRTIESSRHGELTLIFTAPNPHDDDVGPPHIGIPVEIRRVSGIDLTTADGWHSIAGMSVEDALTLPAGAFDVARTGVSDAGGEVYFPDLPLGLYAVDSAQRKAPAIDPFVVTLPMKDSSTSRWNYSVTAYPKTSDPDAAAVGTMPSDTTSAELSNPEAPEIASDPGESDLMTSGDGVEPTDSLYGVTERTEVPSESDDTVRAQKLTAFAGGTSGGVSSASTDAAASGDSPPAGEPPQGWIQPPNSGSAATGGMFTAFTVVLLVFAVRALVLIRRRTSDGPKP